MDTFLTAFVRFTRCYCASYTMPCLPLGFLLRECLGDAHEPCDCETWKMWLQKVSEMKPEERRNSRLYCVVLPDRAFNQMTSACINV